MRKRLNREEKKEKNRLRVKAWRAANRDRARELSRRWWKRNPLYAQKQAERRKRNGREKEFAYRKARRLKPETWAIDVLRDIRRRCKNRGIPYNLVATDLVVPELCPILLLPILFGQRSAHPQAPSVDRIIPENGYVKGNVRVISYRANSMKSDCVDPSVFRRLADYIEANLAGNAIIPQAAAEFVKAFMGG